MSTPSTIAECISAIAELAERADNDEGLYEDGYNPRPFIKDVQGLAKRLTVLYAETLKAHEQEVENAVRAENESNLNEVISWLADDPSIKPLLSTKNMTLTRALSIIQNRTVYTTKAKEFVERVYNRAWDGITRIFKLLDAADSTNQMHGEGRGMIVLIEEMARRERNELEDFHLALRNEIDDRIPF